MTSFRCFYSSAAKRAASAILAMGLGLAIAGCNSVTDVNDNKLGVSVSVPVLSVVGDSISATLTNTSSDTRYIVPCYTVQQQVTSGSKSSWQNRIDLSLLCTGVYEPIVLVAGAKLELRDLLWNSPYTPLDAGTYRIGFSAQSAPYWVDGSTSELVWSNAIEVR